MRRVLAVVAAVALLMVGTATPAEAHRRPQTVRVVIETDAMRAGTEQAVGIWNRDQSDYRLTVSDRCGRGRCITVGETWDAGDWYQLDGIDYGGYSWQDGRHCTVELPMVLTHEPLLARFSAALDSAGQSRSGVPIDVWVQGGVAAHEIGHCLGYDDRPGAGVMSSFPDDRLT
jgi:hypothetical protein